MSNVPTRIGNYKLERQIGKGGTGEVWLGRHQTLENRLSAIKLLMSQDPEWVDRFGREASITSRLRHDHIIQIFDHGYQPPFYYTIMEYVTGGALRSLLRKRRVWLMLGGGAVPRRVHASRAASSPFCAQR